MYFLTKATENRFSFSDELLVLIVFLFFVSNYISGNSSVQHQLLSILYMTREQTQSFWLTSEHWLVLTAGTGHQEATC